MATRALFGASLLGAGLMYFMDPVLGRRRRARIRDQATHALARERALLGKARRDLSHRAHGAVERVKHLGEPSVDDGVLDGRVRARLGRLAPGCDIDVAVTDGCVSLRGRVPEADHARIVRKIGRVRGVCDVDDRLVADTSQTEGRALRTGDWSPSERVAAIGAGGALATWGLASRGLVGRAAMVGGAALAVRGAMAGAIRRPVDVEKTITVHAPTSQVFWLWTRFEAFPRFMDHVIDVRTEGKRSHWKVHGPLGAPITFDAEVTHLVQNRLIAWRTLPGQAIEHSGLVHFEPVDTGTRVQIHLRYQPPGGRLGHLFARMLGCDPKSRMNRDLVRMKALLETGRTRAHGTRVIAREVH